MNLKALTAAAVFFAAFGSATAQTVSTPNVVFLSTIEDQYVPRVSSGKTHHDWSRYIDRPFRAFDKVLASQGGALENWDEWLTVSANTHDEAALQAALQAADIIVIATAYKEIDTTRFNNIIKPLIENTNPKKPQAFIAFAYGPHDGDNFRLFSSTLSGIIGAGADAYKGVSGVQAFPVNDESPYSGAAKSVLPAIESGSNRYMKGIPSEFALYTIDALAPGAATANAHVTFVPHIGNKGNACVILVGTANVFIAQATNTERDAAAENIAEAFMATLDAHCKPSEYDIKVDPVAEGTVTCSRTTVTAGEMVTCTATPADGFEFVQMDVSSTGAMPTMTCSANVCALENVMGTLTVQGLFRALPQSQPGHPVQPQPHACPTSCSSAPAFGSVGMALSALALPAFAAPALRRRKKQGEKADTRQ